MKRMIIIPLFALSCAIALSGCKTQNSERIDLSGIHTTVAETMSSTTAAPIVVTTAPIQVSDTDSTKQASSTASSTQNVAANLHTYKSGKLSIEYPAVSNLGDTSKETSINNLLKSNALSIIDAYPVDEKTDTLSIACKVISIDRKRLTATYTGTFLAKDAAYPIDIFYSNTVDLTAGSNLGFSDYSDAYTMAGYVLSDDCRFYNVSKDVELAAQEYKATQTIEYYTKLFQNADFPLEDAKPNQISLFPESFSYTKQGSIYFSIPVPHAFGDYVLVVFTPETK